MSLEAFRCLMKFVSILDEQHKLGTCHVQELVATIDYLSRKSLLESSPLVKQVSLTQQSEYASAYFARGCRHPKIEKDSVRKYEILLTKLRMHVEELQGLQDDLHLSFHSIHETAESVCFGKGEILQSDEAACNVKGVHSQWNKTEVFEKPFDYLTMAAALVKMVDEDIKMKKAIVEALDLSTPLDELQTYEMMWCLRPYIDDDILTEALSWL